MIRLATIEDLNEVIEVVRRNMKDIGYFINQGIIIESIKSKRLLICIDNKIVGICIFNIRKKDSKFIIYDIITDKPYRGKGYGKELINYIKSNFKNDIQLKCPVDSISNIFYEKCNFKLFGTEKGKHRELNVWTYEQGNQIRL